MLPFFSLSLLSQLMQNEGFMIYPLMNENDNMRLTDPQFEVYFLSWGEPPFNMAYTPITMCYCLQRKQLSLALCGALLF